jgi:hypothetical protein
MNRTLTTRIHVGIARRRDLERSPTVDLDRRRCLVPHRQFSSAHLRNDDSDGPGPVHLPREGTLRFPASRVRIRTHPLPPLPCVSSKSVRPLSAHVASYLPLTPCTRTAGSMLCAQHALNNLLQASLFTPQDLADMARQLDALEAEQLDDVPAGFGTGESPNYDDSGFFSIMGESTPLPSRLGAHASVVVLEEALKVLGLRLVRWQSQEMVERHENPE